jgi:hypothetical protein
LDSANRSFFALVATSLVPYVLLGFFGCGMLSLAAHRLVTDGLAGPNRDGQGLRPAVVFFAVVTGSTLAAAVSVRRQVLATRALASSLRERAVRKMSTSLGQVVHGFSESGVSSFGLLIHAAAGSSRGVGGLRTNRWG